ncbi:hypothetical protein IC232_06065 [Microvirga sp. BT688]|uniref:calcium-binding protein n=1 Tax=Microvirga sp. TaxID=1873136 RepID=UPI0016840E9D|nr:calcium-binding protein [Microvirga sp.]MBD2746263.1 hypothetical protein [Microvirga sp.]
MTALEDGGFAVTYYNMPDPVNGAYEDIRIATFDSHGTARGETILTDSNASDATVTTLADGRLLVTWINWIGEDPDHPKADIRAQIVDPRGAGVSLTGTSRDDFYVGSASNDHLNGDAGNDRPEAGDGNDSLTGGAGADTLVGGAGDDVYYVDASDTIIEGAGQGIDTVYVTTDFTLSPGAVIENIVLLTTATVRLLGNELDNLLTGNGDANNLDGQAGNDLVVGGAGADTMTGGLGNDTLYVDDAGDVVVEAASQGLDTVMVNTAAYVLGAGAEVETLMAGAGALNITGSDVANAISGNGFNNQLWGKADNDVLTGIVGNDRLYGGTGNDRLSGGVGNDQLKGESGRDVFVFDTRTNKSTNVDKVLDFKSADDSLHLYNAIFTKLGRGSAAGVRFKSDMFVEGSRANRIVYDKKTGALHYDKDGTGGSAQVKIATISNKTKLYYHDFFVI